MEIRKNLNKVRQVIDETKPLNQDVSIVAATKYVDAQTIKQLVQEGIMLIGENRAESLLEKKQILQALPIEWHLIGTLQTKKVKRVINEVDVLHSLDRQTLAQEIEKYRHEILPCFLQVNVSQEASKQGLAVTEVQSFVQAMKSFSKIKIIGLMTMAPADATDDEILTYFKTLKEIQEGIRSMNLAYAPCTELSMGMSNDYHIAIQAGATHIRLGSVLFAE